MTTSYTISQGWLQQARRLDSPNHNGRPVGCEIDTLVIHNISLPPGQFGGGCIEAFFLNELDCTAHPYFQEIEGLQVSAHLLIARDGSLTQFVPFTQRAWHAGQSRFCGRDNCNDFSIGIELEGQDDEPYTDKQYRVLQDVTRALQQAYPRITSDRIVGHCDIAPQRKTDPGPAFDWQRYRNSL